MPRIADHALRILGEIRGRMTLAEVTETLNNEVGSASRPYTQDQLEPVSAELVVQKRIAQIDDRPPAYMAVAAKVVHCSRDHDMTVMYLLGTAETMHGVKCPKCGVVTMASAGQLIRQD